MEGEGGKKMSAVSDSTLCETQFSHPLLFCLVPLWRRCLCDGRKNRPALFRLVSAIMKKHHQLKNGGSLRHLSQHSADNNYWLLSRDKKKTVQGKRTEDDALFPDRVDLSIIATAKKLEWKGKFFSTINKVILLSGVFLPLPCDWRGVRVPVRSMQWVLVRPALVD